MSSELQSYKSFIDDVVSIKKDVKSDWILNGSFPNLPESKETNNVLVDLTEEQRNAIAALVQNAKESGIHDLLALLNDKAEIEYEGCRLPKEPFGTELNFDFVARCEGDEWPVK